MTIRILAVAAVTLALQACNCGSGMQQMTGGGSAGGQANATGGGNTAGGSTAGGSTAGGSTAGGSTAGGSTAGGSTAGGSTAGGSTAGGSTAGGSTAGGSTAGGSTAGGSTAGGSTAGGSTAGGSTAGGAAGGSTAGGAAGGSTAGGAAGGSTAGGAAGGSTAGGSAGGLTDGGVDIGCAVVLPIRHDAGTMDGFCSAPLPVGTPPALVYGDTRTGFDTQTTCGLGIAGSGERNYRITVPTAGELTIDLTNLSFDAGFKPVIGVYTNCQFNSGYPRGCLPSHPSLPVTHLVMPALDAGSYIVAVDGFDGTSGDFSLSMCLRQTRVSAAGDTCANPVPLAFTGQSAFLEGNTLGMNDDVAFVRDDGVPCLGEIDRTFSLDLPDAGPGTVWDVHARAWPLTDESFDPFLVFIDSCTDAGIVDAGVIACGTGMGGSPSGHPFTASLNHHLGSGRHFLSLQGAAAIQGRPEASFALQVEYARVGSVSNDLCSASSPALQPNTSYAGTLLGATNQLDQPLCADLSGQNGAGAEVFYRYVATATGMATFELQPELGTSFYLGVFSACAASSCLTMQNANGVQGETRTTLPVVQGTTYFLMVEEYDVGPTPATIALGNRGAFGIRVTQ